MDVLAAAADLVSAAGLVQGAFGLAFARRFAARRQAVPSARPPVTVLKPLHGDEPLLEDALASLCLQDYPDLQIVFGVQDAADPALRTVRRLRARFPALDIAVVVNGAQHGQNRKIGNLINMYPVAKHGIIVIADSDIHAAPGYLDQVVAALEAPSVGLVTTLYAGLRANGSLVARLGAAGINHGFLPSYLLARALGRQDCLGATMALRRETLERAGGFAVLAAYLADDAVLGRRVRALGLDVALAGVVTETTVPESTMPALFNHELRWARTTQRLEPLGYALSVVQYPLAWAALSLCLGGADDWWSWAAFALAWGLRWVTTQAIERALGISSGLAAWQLPLREFLSTAVHLASYGSGRVAWRGQILRVDAPALLAEKGWTVP